VGKPPSTGRDKPTVPTDREMAVTTPSTPMLDHSFTLQAVMELQKSVAELSTKTERLIRDVENQVAKIDEVRHQISFVRGAVWVIGGLSALLVLASAGVALYARLIH
jgi:hypothetical protein